MSTIITPPTPETRDALTNTNKMKIDVPYLAHFLGVDEAEVNSDVRVMWKRIAYHYFEGGEPTIREMNKLITVHHIPAYAGHTSGIEVLKILLGKQAFTPEIPRPAPVIPTSTPAPSTSTPLQIESEMSYNTRSKKRLQRAEIEPAKHQMKAEFDESHSPLFDSYAGAKKKAMYDDASMQASSSNAYVAPSPSYTTRPVTPRSSMANQERPRDLPYGYTQYSPRPRSLHSGMRQFTTADRERGIAALQAWRGANTDSYYLVMPKPRLIPHKAGYGIPRNAIQYFDRNSPKIRSRTKTMKNGRTYTSRKIIGGYDVNAGVRQRHNIMVRRGELANPRKGSKGASKLYSLSS